VTRDPLFTAARLFGEPFRVVKVDKSAGEDCGPPAGFFAQFRRFFLVQFSESAKKGLTLVVRCVNL